MFNRLFKDQAKKEPAPDVPKVAPTDRIYAVGDVHGRVDLLNGMIKKIALDILEHEDERTPRIIFLGDYIDRGDHSKDVIDVLISFEGTLPKERLRFLMGNHEAALLSFLQDPTGRAEWLRFGGLQTLSSYGVVPPKSNPDPADLIGVADALRAAMGPHISFLMSFERIIRSGDVVFAHAGIEPGVALENQDEDAILWGRSNFIEAGGEKGLRVVHGHYDANEPVLTPARICVDTGAYYSGRLTAVRLDAEEKLLVMDVLDILD